MSMKRQSETNIVDFEGETNSDDEYELDEEEGDISWLFGEYEYDESSDEEFNLSGKHFIIQIYDKRKAEIENKKRELYFRLYLSFFL